jgi:hypothetical protein
MIRMLQKVGFVITFCLIVSCSRNEQSTLAPLTPTEERLSVSPTDRVTDSATVTNRYVGLKYPPLPSSITMGSGRAIWKPSTPISWAVDASMDNENLMLWLSKVIDYDQAGRPFFEVRDVLLLPSWVKDKDFVVGECVYAGEPDFELVALVNADDLGLNSRWLPNEKIISVWRANLSTGKFESMSTEHIECNAETFIGFP